MLGRLIGSITDARRKTELTAQLQYALSSRVLIEQAKGVLMEREGIDAQRALEVLRRRARSSERRLADVAASCWPAAPKQVSAGLSGLPVPRRQVPANERTQTSSFPTTEAFLAWVHAPTPRHGIPPSCSP